MQLSQFFLTDLTATHLISQVLGMLFTNLIPSSILSNNKGITPFATTANVNGTLRDAVLVLIQDCRTEFLCLSGSYQATRPKRGAYDTEDSLSEGFCFV